MKIKLKHFSYEGREIQGNSSQDMEDLKEHSLREVEIIFTNYTRIYFRSQESSEKTREEEEFKNPVQLFLSGGGEAQGKNSTEESYFEGWRNVLRTLPPEIPSGTEICVMIQKNLRKNNAYLRRYEIQKINLYQELNLYCN